MERITSTPLPLGWPGRVVIAEPVPIVRAGVNEMSLRGTTPALSRTFWPVYLIPPNARQEGEPVICLSQCIQYRRDKPKVQAKQSQGAQLKPMDNCPAQVVPLDISHVTGILSGANVSRQDHKASVTVRLTACCAAPSRPAGASSSSRAWKYAASRLERKRPRGPPPSPRVVVRLCGRSPPPAKQTEPEEGAPQKHQRSGLRDAVRKILAARYWRTRRSGGRR